MIDRKWAKLNTIKSELPLSKDKMLAKWEDKSYAKLFKYDTIGVRGISALWIISKC